MKNGGYEYENFNHFFGLPILKLLLLPIFRPQGHSFHIFLYRLEYVRVLKIAKIFFLIKFNHKCLFLYTIR